MQKEVHEQLGIIFREKGTLEHTKGISELS
jgi:hypothetical protein